MRNLLCWLNLLLVSSCAGAVSIPVCSTTIISNQIELSKGSPGTQVGFFPVYAVALDVNAGDSILVDSSFEIISGLSYPAELYRYLAASVSGFPVAEISSNAPKAINFDGLVTSPISGDVLTPGATSSKRDALVGWHKAPSTGKLYFSLMVYATSKNGHDSDVLSVPAGYGHICVTNFGH